MHYHSMREMSVRELMRWKASWVKDDRDQHKKRCGPTVGAELCSDVEEPSGEIVDGVAGVVVAAAAVEVGALGNA